MSDSRIVNYRFIRQRTYDDILRDPSTNFHHLVVSHLGRISPVHAFYKRNIAPSIRKASEGPIATM